MFDALSMWDFMSMIPIPIENTLRKAAGSTRWIYQGWNLWGLGSFHRSGVMMKVVRTCSNDELSSIIPEEFIIIHYSSTFVNSDPEWNIRMKRTWLIDVNSERCNPRVLMLWITTNHGWSQPLKPPMFFHPRIFAFRCSPGQGHPMIPSQHMRTEQLPTPYSCCSF